MKPVLIACEESGTVRDALIRRGIPAVSCDLLPPRIIPSPHIQGDVRDILDPDRWSGMIAFPDCTYHTCSAEWAYADPDYERYPETGYHQKVKPGTLTGKARRDARREAVEFFLQLYHSGIKRIAIENPRGRIRAATGIKRSQIIHPFHFGDDASKATYLWLRGLPPLRHTKLIEPRWTAQGPRWANQTDAGQNREAPGPTRRRDRSKTYPGIADAMADQWGPYFMGEQS